MLLRQVALGFLKTHLSRGEVSPTYAWDEWGFLNFDFVSHVSLLWWTRSLAFVGYHYEKWCLWIIATFHFCLFTLGNFSTSVLPFFSLLLKPSFSLALCLRSSSILAFSVPWSVFWCHSHRVLKVTSLSGTFLPCPFFFAFIVTGFFAIHRTLGFIVSFSSNLAWRDTSF
jgi:hypothetical protein